MKTVTGYRGHADTAIGYNAGPPFVWEYDAVPFDIPHGDFVLRSVRLGLDSHRLTELCVERNQHCVARLNGDKGDGKLRAAQRATYRLWKAENAARSKKRHPQNARIVREVVEAQLKQQEEMWGRHGARCYQVLKDRR